MIGLDAGMHGLSLLIQVFVLDLLLSGDNAIVIALACRHLPARQTRQAMLIGIGAAVGLRVLFTSVITFLLNIPGLKLLGMCALVVIAIKLLVEEKTVEQGLDDVPARAGASVWSAVGLIIFADLTMSLDNVVALAAIAQDNLSILVLGLLLSVPLLMVGSVFVSGLFKRYPLLIPAGCALLGWIAGDIGMSDPLIAEWVTAQAPGLTLAMPVACAVFVWVESGIIRKNLRLFPKPRPVALPVMVNERVAFVPPQRRTPAVMDSVPSDALASVEVVTALPFSDATPRPSLWERKGLRYALVSLLAVPLLGFLGWSVIYGGIIQGGYMPTPRQPHSYECPGFNGPFVFFYQHGKDTVRIRASSGALDGAIIKGKLEWMNATGAGSVLGFTPPQEITNDDATSIRINGGSFSQMVCVKKDAGN